MSKETFQLLAEYNQWMNAKLLDAASQLSDDDLRRDRGAFFGSVLGTLNHILVGDIIWLKRFALGAHHFESLDRVSGVAIPDSLDALLYDDLDALRAIREELDADIVSFCDELTAEQLAEKLDYKDFVGDSYTDPLGLLVQHLFNHQTHHRGQTTTLLSQSGIDVGPTDLLVCIRDL